MQRNNPWQSYQQIATQTAQPGQLVLMLFDGAIRFLEKARLGFQEEDPLAFNLTINNNVQRAQAIINELNASLNMTQGGEFAANLRRLYNYMDHRLQESNLTKRVNGIEEVIQRLTVLRDAWSEMLRTRGASEAAEPFPVAALA
ncbi:MAG: flagellar export chaperone FliS [Verrucomicrobiota bacterium]|jgi:flagellar secretion chaperone FliS